MAEGQPIGKSETAKREEEVLAFWRENKTFEKSLEKDASKGEFVFYDGPPFATGLPHHGSLLSSVIKDVVPRYKTMRGYRVRRRWGWDTHGLPIESLVEKELGLKTKKDILDVGIAAFNGKARSMVLQFVNEWEKYVDRVGRWVDFKNSYKTMDNSYIESVWWALKQLWDKQLLYEGNKVLMYCPHCETPLAKAEIAMDNTYKDVTEEAVTVRFKVKRPAQYGLPDNTYFLAWTTTPWTLPGNVALAVGKDISYVILPEESGMVIMAASRIDMWRGSTRPKVMVDMGKSYKGSDLAGIEYEPLFEVPSIGQASGKKYVVVTADFVGEEEGTGIVHTAVMYGEDDFALGQKEGLPMVQLLNPNGTFNAEAPEALRGKYLKDAEKDIKKDLEARGLMFQRQNNTHSYPHCYRCGTPLIYNAVSSWFINIQKVKSTLLTENQKITWVPSHLKDGRFGNIIESAPDWTISRNRFWASPLPIWKSKEGKVMVIGSVDELKKRVKKSGNQFWVMRHGEAENNVKNIVTTDANNEYGLTETGKSQSVAAAQKLSGITKIYASPVRRARETAEQIADTLGIKRSAIVYDPRLGELNFGELNNKTFTEFADYRKNNMRSLGDPVPGGESYQDAKTRFGNFIAEIDSALSKENVLIVSHGIGCESLRMVQDALDEAASWKMVYEKTHNYAHVEQINYARLPVNAQFALDLHRPYTDDIVLLDDAGAEYLRIPEVVDCWVESGSMPFAEYHYPFENKDVFEKRAPGDFIAEYIAQTRTWFYYMHAMGVLLFDRLAFKSVVSTGNILGNDGLKMSKSKGNYTDPLLVVDQFGADAYRLHLMGSVVMQSEDFVFRDQDVRDAHNRTVGILWNTFKFFDLYQKEYDGKTRAHASTHMLDRWILARLDEVINEMTAAMDAYDTPRACRVLKSFADDYSTWYVRRSRERLKSVSRDKQYSLATQREVLLTFAKLIAPLMPFIAESIWRGIEKEGSVHLATWPEVHRGLWARIFGTQKPDGLLKDMAHARATVSRALEARDKAGLKVRQPLQSLTVRVALSPELQEIVAEEVNVKNILVNASTPEGEVRLDTEITPELKEEGEVRELLRAIQDARKKAGLQQGQSAKVQVKSALGAVIEKHKDELQKQTSTEIQSEAGEVLEVTIL